MAKPTEDQPRSHLFVKEAAKYVRVHPGTMYRWLETGRIPAAKIGQRWYVRREVLDAMLSGGAA